LAASLLLLAASLLLAAPVPVLPFSATVRTARARADQGDDGESGQRS
jgi:hypothetical protein